MLAETTRPFFTETPTVFDALLFGVPHRFADPCAAIPFPQQETVVYLSGPLYGAEQGGLEACLARLRDDGGGQPRARPSSWPDGVSYRTYGWDGAGRDAVLAGLAPLGQAYRLPTTSYSLPMRPRRPRTCARPSPSHLAWWVREPALARKRHPFHGAGPVRRWQPDRSGRSCRFPVELLEGGRPGVSRFPIPLDGAIEPGVYQVRAGMYDYPDVQSVPVVDVTGRPVDDAVLLTQVMIMRDSVRD